MNSAPPPPPESAHLAHLTSENRSRLKPRWTDHRYTGLVKLRQAMKHAIAKHVAPLRETASSREVMAVDLGCGTLPYQPLFTPFVSRYLGADLPENPQAELSINATTGQVDIEGESADLIISTQVLEHVESPNAYLTEAHRICRPGGLLMLSTHGFWPYHPDPTDYWRWTADGLTKLLAQHGWETVELTGILGLAPTSIMLFQDALAPHIPRPLRILFTTFTQHLSGFLDRFCTTKGRQRNAAVYLIIARRSKASPA